MSLGFSALKKKKYGKARKAFLAARDIKPDALEAADALKLTDSEYKSLQINEYMRKAAVFENEEKWLEAEKIYKAALDLDPSLDFAIEGKKRSDFFLKLNNEMDYMINHPDRLSSDEPYNKALKILEKAESRQPKGPKLKKKIARAEKILAVARIALPVTLESDGRTNIVVYKIGNLGRFARLILNLYPGTYIAVGSCPGYQDIRKEFAVTAGASPEAIYIRCEEPI
jgi:tetratricopeptide (TPR) repeat protein